MRAHKTERFKVADVAISVRCLGLWMKQQMNADNLANQGIPGMHLMLLLQYVSGPTINRQLNADNLILLFQYVCGWYSDVKYKGKNYKNADNEKSTRGKKEFDIALDLPMYLIVCRF